VTPATTTGPSAATPAPSSTAAEQFARRRQSPVQRIQHVLHSHPAISPLLLLVVAFVVFNYLNPNFGTMRTQSLIMQQVAVVGALAIGQTLIILTAGILSGLVCKRIGLSMLVGYLLAGALIGNGVLGLVAGENHQLEELANVGALLLLFSIGVEFSLEEIDEDCDVHIGCKGE